MPNYEWERPMAMVDIVLLTLKDDRLHLVLLRRDKEPHAGVPALVGGFVHVSEDEDLNEAVARILKDKAGLKSIFVEQLGTFGSRKRDARGWSLTVGYLALLPMHRIEMLKRKDLVVVPLDERPSLPFDHDAIVEHAIERLRSKSSYSTLPAMLLPPTFTFSELQRVYELSTQRRMDVANFRRKMTDLAIEETGEKSSRDSKRPAVVYRLRPGAYLFDRTI